MNTRSIRWRLTVWYSLALAAGLGLFAVSIWLSMRHSLIADLDNALADDLRSVKAFLGSEMAEADAHLSEEIEEYSRAFPQQTGLAILDEKGGVVFASDPSFPRAGIHDSAFTVTRITWHGQTYRVRVEPIIVNGRACRIQIASSMAAVSRALDRLRMLLLALIPAVMLAAGAGGMWLSRRALKPVNDITMAAARIGIGNLSERLIVPETGDELQRLSETWNSMLARLEDAVKRLSRFTADASHELRTPLAVIRTTAEIAARKPRAAETYRESLTQIVNESERLTGIVDDLLFLARCDSERVEMPMSGVALTEIVDDVCSLLAKLAESKSITIEKDFPKGDLLVYGNESAIRRLVLVLLDNAVKYSRGGGRVEVRLRKSAAEIHLEIMDSGPGIPESEIPLIFERFYRSPRSRDGSVSGTGLGLALAAGIAERHKARIEVASEQDRGATFRVLFPQMAGWSRT